MTSKMSRISFILLFSILPYFLFCQVLLGPKKRIAEIFDLANNSSLDYLTNIDLGDLDNDGQVDLVLSANNSLIRYEKLENYTDFIVVDTIISSLGPLSKLKIADVDNDGDLDVLYYAVESTTSVDDKIVWQENLDGQATFGAPTTIALEPPNGIGIGDLDGDGDNDLVVSPASDIRRLRWYENVGNQDLFIERGDFSSSLGMRNIQIVDLDLDNDLDVLVYAGSTIRLFFNDGAGVFSGENGTVGYSGTTIHATGGLTNLDLGENSVFDFDSDGDLDIIAAMTGIWNDGTYLFENVNGEYQSDELILNSEQWAHVPIEFFDIDADGDLDLISTNKYVDMNSDPDQYYCLDIVWNENKLNIDGTFEEEQIFYTECADSYPSIKDFFPIDADNDGDVDLFFLTEFSSEHIFWFENLLNNPSISGNCFFDENQNKIKDSGEIELDHSLLITPEEIIKINTSQDSFLYVLNPGYHSISPTLNNSWNLTTDSSSYSFILTDSLISNLNFGFYPSEILNDIESDIVSNPTRCGFQVPFWINYKNSGTTYSNGQLEFEVDSLSLLVSAEPIPDDIIDNRLIWQFDSLPPTYSNRINLTLQMPGVDYLGDTLHFQASTFYENEAGDLVLSNMEDYQPVLNCAYDPNDKMVEPKGYGLENYTLFGTSLEYKVRFQNTGTDTAFTVKIEDRLDPDLDWSTFQVLSSSHNHQVSFNQENGAIDFVFSNILLPDSTTNEIASHGYIKYSIDPNENMEENTLVSNTANIFFDFNPPITTNTTTNTYISGTVGTTSLVPEYHIQIIPNPFQDYFKISAGDLQLSNEISFNLFDLNGKRILSRSVQENTDTVVNTWNLSSGFYFFSINDVFGNRIYGGKLIKH